MRLTLITVTFNAERYLERTIRSILAQSTLDGVEYLVIDGASKDSTLSIVRRYETHISRWISEPDAGIYDAMNKGLALATGEFVWFLNAGDQLHDEHVIARLYERWSEATDVYYGDALLVDDDDRALGLRSEVTPHRLPQRATWRDFERGMVICHQSFVMRRSLAPSYRLAYPFSADIDWEIRCLKVARNVVNLQIPLSNYLVGGFSVKNHRRSLYDRFLILREHFGLLPTLWNHVRIAWRAVMGRSGRTTFFVVRPL
ncbi:MAG: glycosyltransferase [Cytophagaceae bacterium]|nr:glycosyltransferase [Cytophagaceae bacterium]